MARSLIIESKLPKNLWAYAVMTATHIRNRCYSQRIHNTPYGLITGLKPNVAKLHVFGTVCYSYTYNAKKLYPRSKKGLFVGYDKESPSYNYPETRSVMKHRLVKFTDKFNATEPLVEEMMLSKSNQISHCHQKPLTMKNNVIVPETDNHQITWAMILQMMTVLITLTTVTC